MLYCYTIVNVLEVIRGGCDMLDLFKHPGGWLIGWFYTLLVPYRILVPFCIIFRFLLDKYLSYF